MSEGIDPPHSAKALTQSLREALARIEQAAWSPWPDQEAWRKFILDTCRAALSAPEAPGDELFFANEAGEVLRGRIQQLETALLNLTQALNDWTKRGFSPTFPDSRTASAMGRAIALLAGSKP